ncbi:MAG: Crp/Fnr family transcriptional regulator [Chryseobacterium sp.]|nr:Crp/Fnr family transcriptional regulator [Chryseobacterium sp.]
MTKIETLKRIVSSLNDIFFRKVDENGIQTTIESQKEIINKGYKTHQYVPILLNGSLKVYSLDLRSEFSYYYLRFFTNCILTFSCLFKMVNHMYAYAEEFSEVILLAVKRKCSSQSFLPKNEK